MFSHQKIPTSDRLDLKRHHYREICSSSIPQRLRWWRHQFAWTTRLPVQAGLRPPSLGIPTCASVFSGYPASVTVVATVHHAPQSKPYRLDAVTGQCSTYCFTANDGPTLAWRQVGRRFISATRLERMQERTDGQTVG